MYQPEHFAERSVQELHRIIRQYPLAALVTHAAQGLDANHLPFELDAARGAAGTLQGHVARANPLWREVPDGSEVLVIFRGPHGYISPNWYPSKHESQRQVPTWNYEVVHAHGKLRIVDEERSVRAIVARLTRTHEASQPRPWRMGDAPADYLDQMLQMIVGIEVEITRLEGKRKLSQNREARDFEGAVQGLQNSGQSELASAMTGTRMPN